jgi:hypothetical protein
MAAILAARPSIFAEFEGLDFLFGCTEMQRPQKNGSMNCCPHWGQAETDGDPIAFSQSTNSDEDAGVLTSAFSVQAIENKWHALPEHS